MRFFCFFLFFFLGFYFVSFIELTGFLFSMDTVAVSNGDFGTGDDSTDDFEDIDEEIDDEENEALFSASTAVAIEKECAGDAIAEIFSAVKAPFLPYVETVVRALLPGLKHQWHDGIRKSSVSALLSFITTFHEMSDTPKWKKGSAGVSFY